jgi:hypothetical protein
MLCGSTSCCAVPQVPIHAEAVEAEVLFLGSLHEVKKIEIKINITIVLKFR